MKRHETPSDVAIRLAGFLPRNVTRVLDPAVGNGALLLPVLNLRSLANAEFVLIDVDEKVINRLRSRSDFPRSTKFVCSDFLTWAGRRGYERFDVVIMNPPFAAGKSEHVYLAPCELSPIARYMPLEAAFIARAFELLKEDGRLLSILPSSVVTSSSLSWLRKSLFKSGAIVSVHELPPRCFPGVECRMYLLVFDRGRSRSTVRLLNHDLHEPESMHVKVSAFTSSDRLDFGFHVGQKLIRQLEVFDLLAWQSLSDVADVIRGSQRTPCVSKAIVHTSNYRNGEWLGTALSRKFTDVARVRERDLLIKRVGRGASQSLGLAREVVGRLCTDCVLLIRAKDPADYLRILFATKIVLNLPEIKPVIEKGTGASFIEARCLRSLRIPTQAYRIYSKEFKRFSASTIKGDVVAADEIVESVQEALRNGLRQN